MESRAWIFLSHASEDLAVVRLVRNYLESKGASPLIFHLRALEYEKEFWPLIAREIEARRFFLYCESEAAEESDWVARERATVAALPDIKARRIESIDVGTADFDTDVLDEFVRLTKVFPNIAPHDSQAAAPFLKELERVGFQVFDPIKAAGFNWVDAIDAALREAAEEGWVVSFVSARSAASAWFEHEMVQAAALGSRIVPVLLESIPLPPIVHQMQAFDAFTSPSDAPRRLAMHLLRRDPRASFLRV